jgi:amino acid transporter
VRPERTGILSQRQANSIGFWQVTAIGVGGMVGGGIFAVLGLAVQLAGGGTPVAFAAAGAIAGLTAYSYARLSTRIISQGGTVAFLNQAYGPGTWTGSLNVLLWLSYVVMLSLYAHAFGAYAATFFPGSEDIWRRVLMSGSVVAIAGLNLLSARAVGEAEEWIVGVKVAILLFFVAAGVFVVDAQRLTPANWESPLQLVAGGMIIFVAYEGFELIANTAKDVGEPQNVLPRAYYASVAFVVALYVAIAIVVVGSLSTSEVVAARDYALAEAARPFLGSAGFKLIALAAVLSTASALNATLYGAARLSYIVAKDGELPAVLERKIWNKPLEGLLITAVLTLILVNTLDLSSISNAGSSGFLIVFAAVNWANVKLSRAAGDAWQLSAVGAVACLAALTALLWQTLETSAWKLSLVGGLIVGAVGIESAYRLLTGREIRVDRDSGEAGGGGTA